MYNKDIKDSIEITKNSILKKTKINSKETKKSVRFSDTNKIISIDRSSAAIEARTIWLGQSLIADEENVGRISQATLEGKNYIIMVAPERLSEGLRLWNTGKLFPADPENPIPPLEKTFSYTIYHPQNDPKTGEPIPLNTSKNYELDAINLPAIDHEGKPVRNEFIQIWPITEVKRLEDGTLIEKIIDFHVESISLVKSIMPGGEQQFFWLRLPLTKHLNDYMLSSGTPEFYEIPKILSPHSIPVKIYMLPEEDAPLEYNYESLVKHFKSLSETNLTGQKRKIGETCDTNNNATLFHAHKKLRTDEEPSLEN